MEKESKAIENNIKECEPEIVPTEGVIVAKAQSLISQLEILGTDSNPKASWLFTPIAAGKDCTILFDENGNLRKGHIVLEYGDKFKHVPLNNKLSYAQQSRYAKENRVSKSGAEKILIEETVLIPYYNVMGIIENSNVKLDGLTIYQLHRKTNPNLN